MFVLETSSSMGPANIAKNLIMPRSHHLIFCLLLLLLHHHHGFSYPTGKQVPLLRGRGPVGPCLCWKVVVPLGPAIIAKKPHHAQEPSSHLLPSTTTSSSSSWPFLSHAVLQVPLLRGRGPVGPCLCWKVVVPLGPAIIAKKPHHAQEPSSHLLPSTTTSSSSSWLFLSHGPVPGGVPCLFSLISLHLLPCLLACGPYFSLLWRRVYYSKTGPSSEVFPLVNMSLIFSLLLVYPLIPVSLPTLPRLISRSVPAARPACPLALTFTAAWRYKC